MLVRDEDTKEYPNYELPIMNIITIHNSKDWSETAFYCGIRLQARFSTG